MVKKDILSFQRVSKTKKVSMNNEAFWNKLTILIEVSLNTQKKIKFIL